MKILRFKKSHRSVSLLYTFFLTLFLLLISIASHSVHLATVAMIFQFIYFICHTALHSKEILIDVESRIITIAQRFPITFNQSIGFLKDVYALSDDGFVPFVPSSQPASLIFYQGDEYSLVVGNRDSKLFLVG